MRAGDADDSDYLTDSRHGGYNNTGGRTYSKVYRGGYQGRGAPTHAEAGSSGRGRGRDGGAGRGPQRDQGFYERPDFVDHRGRGWGRGGSRGSSYWGSPQGAARGGRSWSQLSGRGTGGGRGHSTAEGTQFLRLLRGHTQTITALHYELEANQLYSGSTDRTVRVWDCELGTCKSVVDVGGPVDSLLLAGGFLFVAVHGLQGPQDRRGVIKVWNTATSAEQHLQGHAGPVLALCVANQMLFSGGQDTTIRAWKLAGERFEAAAVVTAAEGGHSAAVQCLLAAGAFMFSADWQGTLKVWDVAASGQCIQTLPKPHGNLIMAILPWQDFLLTCSLDGTVKIWQLLESAGPEGVIAPQPVYTHPPDDAPGSNRLAADWGGVLGLAGGVDGNQKPIVLTSYNGDGQVRLWELPTFAERGGLQGVQDARCLVAAGPGGFLISGDKVGAIKVWQWDQKV